MRRKRRIASSLLASALLVVLTALPAPAHGFWNLGVSYPQIWHGPIWGGIGANAYFEIEPNHYRLEGKLELQASIGGGPWEVIDTDVRSKTQTGFIRLEVGKTCFMPTGGVRLATFYRTRLAYLRVRTQSGSIHTQYSDLYRPYLRDVEYSSFCSPLF